MPNNIGFGVQAKGVGKASSDIDNLRDKFERMQKQGAKGIGIGIAAGATTFALSAASQAVSSFTDVIGDSIQAALKDEESQNRLRASLLTNVPAWNGNTDAIEANILAKQRLGFQDEDLRDSLTVLVGATHDVAKAQEIQNTAMDLARFKGIDLQTASEALIKVEGGHYKMLAQLGINLKTNATNTEALAAVQKVAAGQAEAYAQTNKGKLEASQIKVGEAMENFGGTIMPAVVEVVGVAADRAVEFANQLSGITGKVDELASHLPIIGESAKTQGVDFLDLGANILGALDPTNISPKLRGISDAMDSLGVDTTNAREIWQSLGFDVVKATDTSTDAVEKMRGAIGKDFDSLETAAVDWRDQYKDVSGDIIRSTNKVRSALAKDAQGIIDDFFDPLETEAQRHDQRMQLFADEERLRKAKTKEESRQAKDDIIADLHDQASSLVKLGEQGKLTKVDVDRFTKDAKQNFDKLGTDGKAQVQAIIDKLNALRKMPNITKTFTINEVVRAQKGSVNDTHGTGRGKLEFAEGGRVPGPKGKPVAATVHGGEFVVSNDMQRQMGASGSAPAMRGGVTFEIHIHAGVGSGVTASSGRQFAAEFGPAIYADMQRRGLLPRGATGLTG